MYEISRRFRYTISKRLYSRYDREELCEKLSDPGLVISDLDGTVHRGLYLGLKGAGYVDLAFSLLLKNPKRSFNFLKSGIRIFLEHCYGTPDPELIKKFANDLLKGVSVKDLRDACTWLPRLAYPGSKDCLAELAKRSKKTMLISRSIDPILEAYSNDIKKEFEVDIHYVGNKLLDNGEFVLGLDSAGKILTAKDKARYARKELFDHETALIFGDQEEDLGMFAAGEDMLDKDCLKIAANPKSEKIKERADVIMYSWKELLELIK
jgi:phosphoserine phosphatase